MQLTETSYWSPTHGAHVIRLAVGDDDGLERYHAFMPLIEGRQYRLIRERAIRALEEASDKGLTFGEVRWRQ